MKTNYLITGLSHIGVKTNDTKKSLDFYKNILGFQHYYHYEMPNGMVLDFLRLAGCKVELIYSPDMTSDNFSKEGTVAHIALEVLNIENLVETLIESGVESIAENSIGAMPELFPTGVKNIFFKGPSGELIELFEHTK